MSDMGNSYFTKQILQNPSMVWSGSNQRQRTVIYIGSDERYFVGSLLLSETFPRFRLTAHRSSYSSSKGRLNDNILFDYDVITHSPPLINHHLRFRW